MRLIFFAFFEKNVVPILTSGGLMGVPIPEIIVKSIEVLKNKAEKEDG